MKIRSKPIAKTEDNSIEMLGKDLRVRYELLIIKTLVVNG